MQRQPSNTCTPCYSLLKLKWSSREGTPGRSIKQTTVQNYSSLNVPAATALLYNCLVSNCRELTPPGNRGKLSPMPCRVQTRCCSSLSPLPRGTRLREGLKWSKQGAFLREAVGSVVFCPLLTLLIQLCVRDRPDTAVLGGGRSLCSFTLPKACAAKYQHRDSFFCFFQVRSWRV